MKYDSLEDWIRTENKRDGSVDDQVVVGRWLYEHGYTSTDDNQIRQQQLKEPLENRIEHTLTTILANLRTIGVVDVSKPSGVQSFIQHERTDTIIFGVSENENKIRDLLNEEVARLLEDVGRQSQPTPAVPTTDGGEIESDEENPSLQDVIAESLGVPSERIEAELTAADESTEDFDDTLDRMQQFDTAVDAVKTSDVVTRKGEYDQMGWRNRANRWTLSERATVIEDRQRA